MADEQRISGMPVAEVVNDDDLIELVQGGLNKRAAASLVREGMIRNHGPLGQRDLNEVTEIGSHIQTTDVVATAARNYPTQLAGTLIVVGGDGSNRWRVQTYVTRNNAVYQRTGSVSAAGVVTWAPGWRVVAVGDDAGRLPFPTIGTGFDSATRAAAVVSQRQTTPITTNRASVTDLVVGVSRNGNSTGRYAVFSPPTPNASGNVMLHLGIEVNIYSDAMNGAHSLIWVDAYSQTTGAFILRKIVTFGAGGAPATSFPVIAGRLADGRLAIAIDLQGVTTWHSIGIPRATLWHAYPQEWLTGWTVEFRNDLDNLTNAVTGVEAGPAATYAALTGTAFTGPVNIGGAFHQYDPTGAVFSSYGAGSGTPKSVVARKAGGSLAAPSAISGVASLAAFIGSGYDGSAFRSVSMLETRSAGAWSANLLPNILRLSKVAATGTALATVAEWGTDNALTLYSAVTASAGLTVAGAATFQNGLTAPTSPLTVSNDMVATTAYVQAAVAALVAASPAALDTLAELAAALGSDPNFATTVTNALAEKQPLNAKLTAFSGLTLAADRLVYATGANTLAVAVLSAFGRSLISASNAGAARITLGAAALASPAFSGTPTAPTAPAGSNSTQLATTEFVQKAVAAGGGGNGGETVAGWSRWDASWSVSGAQGNIVVAWSDTMVLVEIGLIDSGQGLAAYQGAGPDLSSVAAPPEVAAVLSSTLLEGILSGATRIPLTGSGDGAAASVVVAVHGEEGISVRQAVSPGTPDNIGFWSGSRMLMRALP
ncbi:Phage tail fiber protein [plant metagenome]|uniref:Phage tail fiber protein n=1 Tax=plant metagenome TaxID=1297885 RepID=A0A484TFB7_9ZZZZ